MRLYFVLYEEPKADYYALTCYDSKEQSDFLFDIYNDKKTGYGGKARQFEMEMDDLLGFANFDDCLFLLHYDTQTCKTVRCFQLGLDQSLMHKGFDARRLFSFVRWKNAHIITFHMGEGEVLTRYEHLRDIVKRIAPNIF